jgi:hypothetical protein
MEVDMTPESQMVLTAIITALTSSGVMSFIIYLIQRRDKKREKEEANNSAQSRMLLGLGHDRIIYLTDRFVRRGAITLKEKRNLKFLCDPYFDLGGNGDCKIGYDACDKLPVVSEDEAEVMDERLRRKEYGYETE